jgi:integrase/recombinase XerD
MSELAGLLTEYFEWLAVERGLAPNSLAAYRRDLRRYTAYLVSIDVDHPGDIGEATVHGFVEYLKSLCADDGEALLAPASIARSLVAVRSFHRFCAREGHLATDPSEEVGAPRVPQGIPKALDEGEVSALLDAGESDGPRAQRDHSLLEVLYATGIRISEAVGLDLDDLDLENGLLRVLGKGDKERVVPIGRTARAVLEQYLRDGRLQLRAARSRRAADTDAVFLNARGARVSRQACWTIVQRAGARAGIDAELSPHVLRHSCATHMLDHGADLRVVQELLGHASISTTQVYTKVSPDRLRAVYEASHPRARVVVEAGSTGA